MALPDLAAFLLQPWVMESPMKTTWGGVPAATSLRFSSSFSLWRGSHQSTDQDSLSIAGVTDSVR